jgi:quinol monooxygenase YgiN
VDFHKCDHGVSVTGTGVSSLHLIERSGTDCVWIRGTTMMERRVPVLSKEPRFNGAMRDALLEVAENVRANEPETIGFFVSQDEKNPCVFTTYERFADRAAMDRHNSSGIVARFFGMAKPILDGDVTLVTCSELFAKD